jgi:hypothetical protein
MRPERFQKPLRHFYLVALSDGKPDSTPHQARGKLFS